MLVALAAVVATAVLAGAGLARGRPAKTGTAGTFDVINVKLGDKTLILSKHSTSGVQVIQFRIRTVGTVKHNFIVGTHITNAIAPGQFDDVAVTFHDFGKHVYRCTLNCPATSHGVIDVERGDFVSPGGRRRGAQANGPRRTVQFLWTPGEFFQTLRTRSAV